MKARSGCGRAAAACVAALLAACGSTPPVGPGASTTDAEAPALPAPIAAFEHRQLERAEALQRQGALADAELAWETLTLLRPDADDYRSRLVDVRAQIASGVAERMQRAGQAARRGDTDAAVRLYLAVLALQPEHAQAADALRAAEVDRNRRSYLGKYSRFTLTRRAVAEAEMRPPASSVAGRNDVEHASLLLAQGEVDDAIAVLQRRRAADPRDAAARRMLADAYFRQAERLAANDRAGAIAALEKSVRLDPKAAQPAARLKELQGARAAKAGSGKAAASSSSSLAPAAPRGVAGGSL